MCRLKDNVPGGFAVPTGRYPGMAIRVPAGRRTPAAPGRDSALAPGGRAGLQGRDNVLRSIAVPLSQADVLRALELVKLPASGQSLTESGRLTRDPGRRGQGDVRNRDRPDRGPRDGGRAVGGGVGRARAAGRDAGPGRPDGRQGPRCRRPPPRRAGTSGAGRPGAGTRAFRASATSSPSHPGRAASANRRRPATSPSVSLSSACASVCSTPTFSARPCPSCSACKASRRSSRAVS